MLVRWMAAVMVAAAGQVGAQETAAPAPAPVESAAPPAGEAAPPPAAANLTAAPVDPAAAPGAPPAAEPEGGTTYTVKSGDSLWKIAKKFGVTVDAILRFNAKPTDRLSIGDVLKIPPPQPKGATPSVAQEQASLLGPGKYSVRQGDSLWEISRLYGISVQELLKTNNLKSHNLQIGQILLVPPAPPGSAAPVAVAPPPPPGPPPLGPQDAPIRIVPPGESPAPAPVAPSPQPGPPAP